MKRIIVSIVLLVVLIGCSSNTPKAITPDTTETPESSDGNADAKPLARIELKDGSVILLELDLDAAPNTVANFVALAQDGFYDGLIFHRIIENFMIQGGDPLGNGTGGPKLRIKGEFKSNGFNNPLSHQRGVISMARATAPDSAGSQFFIMHKDNAGLDGNYAAFGRVIEGIEVVDAIALTPTGSNDYPKEPPVIASITIDTQGVRIPKPVFVE